VIRIVLRSARPLFADLLAADLGARPEYAMVGSVTELADLRPLCALREPDLAVVHLDGGLGADPNRTVTLLRSCLDLTRVVVLHDHLGGSDLDALVRTGATLVSCSRGLDELLDVLCQHRPEQPRPRPMQGARLTEPEERIIALLAAGHTVAQIAKSLQISESRVANAKHRIYRKLGVDSQGRAVARAVALGIVTRQRPQPRALPLSARCATGEVCVELRGAEGEARKRVAVALSAAGILVHAGAPLLVLADPAAADWPDRGAGEVSRPVVLVQSAPPRRAEVVEALLRGAVAVVTADEVARDLVATLRQSTRGFVSLDAGAGGALLESLRVPAIASPHLPVLTAREGDILRSIADGHTVRRTAQVLGIAEKTVENTQARLFRKLGARNRPGALAAAHALGLMPDGPKVGPVTPAATTQL
jgi:DNA-binding NarL/FixJ family response regulator